jgi:hypothetical protein
MAVVGVVAVFTFFYYFFLLWMMIFRKDKKENAGGVCRCLVSQWNTSSRLDLLRMEHPQNNNNNIK